MRTIDENGYMHVKLTPISKAGVRPYLGSEVPGWEERKLDPSGIYYALMPPEELKKAAETFNGLPLLLNHYEIDADNPDKEHTVGSTGTDTTFDGAYLRNSISITDAEAIKKVEDGTAKEISCCYSLTPDFTPGEFEGVPYDYVIRNIVGNHVALVAEGRAGHDVKVADSATVKAKIVSKKQGEKNMAKKVKDANPLIEKLEVRNANLLKALNAVEAQGEGINPADIGLEIDPTASVEEIVDTFIPDADEDEKAKFISILNAVKGVEPSDDAKEPAQNGDPAQTTEPAAEPVNTDDEPQAVNTESPDYKAGYEAGLRNGQANTTDDGDPKPAVSADSLEKVKQEAKEEAFKHLKELNKAARECEFLIGRQDAMAFDSAEDIYGMALKQEGYDIKKYPKEAWAAMIDVLRAKAPKKFNMDSVSVGGDELSDNLKKYL